MRCCAPFCRNAPDDVPASQDGRRISFHGFPSDVRLRAAWLRALGMKGASLPDPAMVCSEHFMDDDFHETESGSRHIDAAAIPSTVLVCLMCLDTDSKMFLMSKHKLEEAYEYLTGYAPCNQGNLKQTLCVQCAQRLRNFSRFRDQSLRARALMMDLVEKHKLITRRHIKMINRTKYRLESSMVVTTLGADFCDLHIREDTSDDKQTESETTIDTGAVKTEESDDFMEIGEYLDVIYEEDDNAGGAKNEINADDGDADNVNSDFVALHDENISDDSIMLDEKRLDDALFRALQKKPAILDQLAEIQDPLKFESADFKCSLCSEEFVQDLAYMQHMSMHAQSGSAAGESGTTGARAAVGAGPTLSSLAEIKPDAAGPHDGRAGADVAHTSVAPLSASVAISNDSEEHLTEEADAGPSSEQAITIINANLDYQSSDSNSRTNDNIDRYTYSIVNLENALGKKNIQGGEKPFSCKLCEYKSAKNYHLIEHMRKHTGEKPYSCKFCEYKSAHQSDLAVHMRRHTGEKNFSCKLCEYKSVKNSDIVTHMRKHTGEKPYSCELCDFKTGRKFYLVTHMKIHTGEKPFSCKLCEYKTAYKSDLVVHTRKHTGENPFSCKLCEYKTARKCHIVAHMRKHTGEKPYSCTLCEHKTATKTNLTVHMKTHR